MTLKRPGHRTVGENRRKRSSSQRTRTTHGRRTALEDIDARHGRTRTDSNNCRRSVSITLAVRPLFERTARMARARLTLCVSAGDDVRWRELVASTFTRERTASTWSRTTKTITRRRTSRHRRDDGRRVSLTAVFVVVLVLLRAHPRGRGTQQTPLSWPAARRRRRSADVEDSHRRSRHRFSRRRSRRLRCAQ